MPPDLDVQPNPDFPAKRVTELPPDVAALSAFFNVEGFSAALVSQGYTRKELTEQLITQARNAPKPADRMKAIQMLHDMGLELLEVDGQITTRKIKHVQTADGHVIQQSAEQRTINRLRQGAGTSTPDGAVVHAPVRTGDYNPNTPAAIAARESAAREGAGGNKLYAPQGGSGQPDEHVQVPAGQAPAEHAPPVPRPAGEDHPHQ